VAVLRAADRQNAMAIPADLVTASARAFDTPYLAQGALYQVEGFFNGQSAGLPERP